MSISRFFILPILALALIACPAAFTASKVINDASINASQIPVTSAQIFEGCGGPVIDSINNDYEQSVVEQTNQIRMQAGLPPLKRVSGLDQSARYHSADMSVNNYFDHNTLHQINGKEVEVCDTWNRIQNYYTGWEALAENIAAGQRTPDEAMNGWMNSPEHKKNIMSDTYWEIGVGFYQGNGEYHYYWDQNFGRRDGVFPLVVDGDKAKTNKTSVNVYIYGDWDQMRLRNDDGTWGKWIPFQHSFTWQIPGVAGRHTVAAELKGKDGDYSTSDDIQYAP